MKLSFGIAAHRAEPWARRLLATAMFMVMGGAFGAAAATSGEALKTVEGLRPLQQELVVAEEPVMQVVWQGADIDGDGKGDFANPTGNAPREHDAYGSGAFGSSRDGGDRRHEGVDFTAMADQPVVAPMSGFVTRIGYAYDDDRRLTYIEISNPALNYTARAFYVAASVQEGDAVALGQVIGHAEDLQARYPGGMTNHVHLELAKKGRRLDAATLISSRLEPVTKG